MHSTSRLTLGLFYAFAACAFWSTLYIDTTFVAPYGTADLAVLRFLFAAGAALATLLFRGRLGRFFSERTAHEWILATGLGFLGFPGFYFFLATAVKYTSEVITVAIIGMISAVTMVVNNIIYREFKWTAVAGPAVLGIAGVTTIILNQMSIMHAPGAGARLTTAFGVGTAIIALGMWSTYQILNKRALLQLTKISTEDWTLLTLIASTITLPAFAIVLPISPLSNEFVLFTQPIGGDILPLIAWALFLALGPSLLALRAWNASQKHLPPTLGGQTVIFLIPLVYFLGWYYGRFSIQPMGAFVSVTLLMASIATTVVLQHPPTWLPQAIVERIRSLRRTDLDF